MKNVSKIIPCYAADTAGVCSALYELGGMTVVHDASGCNSTYSTHDEPRWYDKKSMIYISALKEIDAVMGNDEKLINDVVCAAKDLIPKFITICGSPMPMMTGVDFDAVAAEIESRSGIRTFGLHTNGTYSYISGAQQAFLAIVKEYVHDMPKADGTGVNVLGATPLDLGINGAIEKIFDWLKSNDLKLISCLGMNSTLEDVKKAASAKVNLVISYTGLPAAEYMQERFGIPYVLGMPIGEKFSQYLAKNLTENSACFTAFSNREPKGDTVVIGEGIYAGSMAAALYHEYGENAWVLCPLECDKDDFYRHETHTLSENERSDLFVSSEEDIERVLKERKVKRIIADPFYRYIAPKDAEFIEIPHFAFSGRCFSFCSCLYDFGNLFARQNRK